MKIYAIVGKSGSGKSLTQSIFDTYGIPRVTSYTTRPRREDEPSDHVFVTEEEFSKLTSQIATTKYGNYSYCGTMPNSPSATYVIDENGLRMLLENPIFDVVTIMIIAHEKDRLKRTDKERYERDYNMQYTLKYDHVILNYGSVNDLNNEVKRILHETN